jgi:peptidoglycan/xylan/chitin deacetylase (PgdA/CDA1 family)
VPAPKGLPILLYHKVSSRHSDALTISVERLDRELAYIKSSGYTPISFSELKESLNGRRALPAKPVVVTFDDAYLSTRDLAYPLLAKHGIKATVFLPTAFIGGVAGWDGASEPLMSFEMIRELSGELIEFGLHSHRHESYEHYSAAQIETDLSQCLRALEDSGCRLHARRSPILRPNAERPGRQSRHARIFPSATISFSPCASDRESTPFR